MRSQLGLCVGYGLVKGNLMQPYQPRDEIEDANEHPVATCQHTYKASSSACLVPDLRSSGTVTSVSRYWRNFSAVL